MLSSKLKAALKEPLVHFIFLGALIFIGYEFVRSGDDHPGAEIVVSDARTASMVQTFIRTWQRPPTESELSRLIDDYIKTEIFVREALAWRDKLHDHIPWAVAFGFGVVVGGAFAKNPTMVRAIPVLRHRYDWRLLDDRESVRLADFLKFLGGYPN